MLEVVEEKTGELVYAFRLNGQTFRPPVFALGAYTVVIGEPGTPRLKRLAGLEAVAGNQTALEIAF